MKTDLKKHIRKEYRADGKFPVRSNNFSDFESNVSLFYQSWCLLEEVEATGDWMGSATSESDTRSAALWESGYLAV